MVSNGCAPSAATSSAKLARLAETRRLLSGQGKETAWAHVAYHAPRSTGSGLIAKTARPRYLRDLELAKATEAKEWIGRNEKLPLGCSRVFCWAYSVHGTGGL